GGGGSRRERGNRLPIARRRGATVAREHATSPDVDQPPHGRDQGDWPGGAPLNPAGGSARWLGEFRKYQSARPRCHPTWATWATPVPAGRLRPRNEWQPPSAGGALPPPRTERVWPDCQLAARTHPTRPEPPATRCGH